MVDGTALEMRQAGQTVSRVRIPPSPRHAKHQGRCTKVQRFCLYGGGRQELAPVRECPYKQKGPSLPVPWCFAPGDPGMCKAACGCANPALSPSLLRSGPPGDIPASLPLRRVPSSFASLTDCGTAPAGALASLGVRPGPQAHPAVDCSRRLSGFFRMCSLGFIG